MSTLVLMKKKKKGGITVYQSIELSVRYYTGFYDLGIFKDLEEFRCEYWFGAWMLWNRLENSIFENSQVCVV